MEQDNHTYEPDRIVRDPEAGKISGLSRTQRWRLEKDGRFPARRRISSRCTGWLMSELQQWLRDREKVTAN
jgi:prophage regulatory protein